MNSDSDFFLSSQWTIPLSPVGEYICHTEINLYDDCGGKSLATQAKRGRFLKIVNPLTVKEKAVLICLCEDHYQAWLSFDDLQSLFPADHAYEKKSFNRSQIEGKIPEVIDFTLNAMKVPNIYLWGGTVAPNYDCSGLIQDSFARVGIWLPRDSYQQENFVQKINQEDLLPGDLIFFGQEKVSHVALYLGDNSYIHSSGQDLGNNGIGINYLQGDQDPVSANYYKILWSFGRVVESF